MLTGSSLSSLYRNRGRGERLELGRRPPRKDLYREPRKRQLSMGRRWPVSIVCVVLLKLALTTIVLPVVSSICQFEGSRRMVILAQTKIYVAKIKANGDPVWRSTSST